MTIDHTHLASRRIDPSTTRSFPARLPAGRRPRRRPDPGPAPAARPMPARRDAFAPNAFIRIGADGTDRPDHALCRDGPGHLHLDPDADRRGAGGGAERRCGWSTRRRTKSSTPIRCWGSRRPAIRTRSAARGKPLRQAGATARTMLVAAAAKRWNVDPASCRAQAGEVLHPPSGRRDQIRRARRRRGAHAGAGQTCRSRQRKDFKLIGTPAKRLDTPAKVNGTAVYGIDVRPPGVKIATLAQSPVFGGRVKRVDDAAAQGRQGRAPDRAARRRRRGRGRPHGRREERPGRARDRMGRRPARRS